MTRRKSDDNVDTRSDGVGSDESVKGWKKTTMTTTKSHHPNRSDRHLDDGFQRRHGPEALR